MGSLGGQERKLVIFAAAALWNLANAAGFCTLDCLPHWRPGWLLLQPVLPNCTLLASLLGGVRGSHTRSLLIALVAATLILACQDGITAIPLY